MQAFITPAKRNNHIIALVPTMGALHKGHISLINAAHHQADIVVCSVFVNPTQFTDPKDLVNYPRPVAHDIAMLEKSGCHAVFMPAVNEMYPEWPTPEKWEIDLGPAEFILEGAFRKGHYQGVTQVVKKLFDAAIPDIAFFGQKDYQQVLMIKNMVAGLRMDVQIITCPIIREPDGLAMSSRNVHLSDEDHQHALALNKALRFVYENQHTHELDTLVREATERLENAPGITLDYFSIADAGSLMPVSDRTQKMIALVAAKVGGTRLIDNILL